MITVSCYSVFVQLLVLWCPDEDAYWLVLTAPTIIRTISVVTFYTIWVLLESSRRGEHIYSVTNCPPSLLLLRVLEPQHSSYAGEAAQFGT